MNNFFRRLSLPVKLLSLILFPLALIIFLAFTVYREKSETADLLDGYVTRINRSADISALISSLQAERKYGYNYVLTRDAGMQPAIVRQRQVTDSVLDWLASQQDASLHQFTSYTFLDSLLPVREKIDAARTTPDIVMHYYTTAIYRLYTLNMAMAGNNKYPDPVFADLTAEKLLTGMITYLEILSTNFYNAIYARQNNVAMLYGLLGVYDIYKSYEKELLVKASPAVVRRYKALRDTTALKPVTAYIDQVFTRFSFDTLYDAGEWWQLSGDASRGIKVLQTDLMQQVKAAMSKAHTDELNDRDLTLLLIALALVVVFGIMVFCTHVITQMLSGINAAAREIAQGNTGVTLQNVSGDVIGSLSDSIRTIGESNRQLAHAADLIGKGHFDTPVQTRGNNDLLGNALLRMRNNLEQFTAAIEKSRQQFEEVADKAPVMIWVSGTDKLCTFFNKGWLDFTGRKPAQEAGNGWMQGVHPDDRAGCAATYTEAFDTREEFYMEYRLRRHDGQYRWIGDTGAPRYSPAGFFEGYIGSCTDIHEVKVLEQRRDDFIKMASHELKTPMTTIKGYVQLLRRMHDGGRDPFLADSLATIDRQVARLTRLIADLLDATRMETGKLPVHPEPLRLGHLAEVLVKDMRTLFTSHNIVLHVQADPLVLADKDRLTQVFSNLLDNAIKYSQPASDVVITLSADREKAMVTVQDSGIGIAPEYHAKVFERFYREPGGQESTFPGFGIGLFIVREIISLHRGNVWVRSEKGKGSVFHITLPLHRPD
ncbi:MAG: ATP-binding protein [Chitinophagaceae bacterium]